MDQEKKNKEPEVLMSATMKAACPVEPKSHKVTILVISGFVLWIIVIVLVVYFSTR